MLNNSEQLSQLNPKAHNTADKCSSQGQSAKRPSAGDYERDKAENVALLRIGNQPFCKEDEQNNLSFTVAPWQSFTPHWPFLSPLHKISVVWSRRYSFSCLSSLIKKCKNHVSPVISSEQGGRWKTVAEVANTVLYQQYYSLKMFHLTRPACCVWMCVRLDNSD